MASVLQATNIPSWRLRSVKTGAIEKLCSYFNDCRMSIEYDVNIGSLSLTYETGMAKKPITFAGMTVDLEDGWIYLTRLGDVPAIKLGLINDVFSKLSGSNVSRDAALRGIEKFKLTGSLPKMFDAVDETLDGSVISMSIHKVVKTGQSVRNENVSAFTKVLKNASEALVEVYDTLSSMDYAFSEDTALQAKRDLMMLRSRRMSSSWVPNANTDEEALFLASTPAYWRDSSLIKDSTKRSLLASNVLEICDSMEGAEDVVISTNVAGRLKNLGFDTLLSSREMSSVASNTAILDTMKKQSSLKASTVNQDTGSIGRALYISGPEDANASAVRNSIKMLHKLIVKIMGSKEGDN